MCAENFDIAICNVGPHAYRIVVFIMAVWKSIQKWRGEKSVRETNKNARIWIHALYSTRWCWLCCTVRSMNIWKSVEQKWEIIDCESSSLEIYKYVEPNWKPWKCIGFWCDCFWFCGHGSEDSFIVFIFILSWLRSVVKLIPFPNGWLFLLLLLFVHINIRHSSSTEYYLD